MQEIDLVAEVLTGDWRHFWLKPSSTPGSPQPRGPHPDTYDQTSEQPKAALFAEASEPVHLKDPAPSRDRRGRPLRGACEEPFGYRGGVRATEN
jgi:hypothetical protein